MLGFPKCHVTPLGDILLVFENRARAEKLKLESGGFR